MDRSRSRSSAISGRRCGSGRLVGSPRRIPTAAAMCWNGLPGWTHVMATPPWPVCSTRPRDSPRWHAARWWSWDASGAVGASGIAPCNCWPFGILSGPRSWRRTMGARSFVARLDAFSKFQSQHVTIQTKVLRQALSSARRSRTSWRCSAERSLRRRLQGDLPYQPCHHRQPPIAALTHIAFDARRVVDQPLRLSQNRGRGCHLARRLRHKLLFRSQLPIETYVGVRPWMRSHRVLAPGGDHQPDPMIMLTVPAARPAAKIAKAGIQGDLGGAVD